MSNAFCIYYPENMAIPQNRTLSQPIELMDVMPTLLDADYYRAPGKG